MQSTTVEIILYYLTFGTKRRKRQSTTVEIILYYLTLLEWSIHVLIYNSRNYSILLNEVNGKVEKLIYNSRNYSILLNDTSFSCCAVSTTVEIILYYLTIQKSERQTRSTTVEIILYYLTNCSSPFQPNLQQ